MAESLVGSPIPISALIERLNAWSLSPTNMRSFFYIFNLHLVKHIF